MRVLLDTNIWNYLAEAGVPHLMQMLAGQAMKSSNPGGLAGALGKIIWAGAKSAPDMSAAGTAAAVAPFNKRIPYYAGQMTYAGGRAADLPLAQTGIPLYQIGHFGTESDRQRNGRAARD